MDLSYLAPQIRHILTGPEVDLSTISAKRVRKQLVAGGLDENLVRDRKSDIDALIAQIYESVSKNAGQTPDDAVVSADHGGKPPPSPGNGSNATPAKRKRPLSPEASYYEPPSSQPQALATKKSKQPNGSAASKRELSDAELARQLSQELNGRSTRNAAVPNTSTSKVKAKPPTKKAKRSKATINSDAEDEDEDGSGKSKAKGGFGKEFALSEALANVTGHTQLSRPQTVKKLWEYIKGNNLQNPSDKREILCDSNMKAVFGADKINMFRMNKILGNHLFELGE